MALILCIAFAVASQAKPLSLIAQTSKRVYSPGEQVVVELKLRNLQDRAVVAATAFDPIYPSASITARLFDATGKEVFASSDQHEGQWMVGRAITKDIFAIGPNCATSSA